MGVLQLGKNTRLMVGDGAATEVFTPVGGEGKLSFSSAPDSIDAASKDDGNYAVECFGQQKISITVSGLTKLPDAGLVRLDALAKLAEAGNIKIVDKADTETPVERFVCSMTVGNRQVDYENKQAVSWSFSLSLAAAPSVDNLFGAAA